ncbi:MAG: class I SAM-dependent methyltransferase [Candidatus Parvarchaeota archaeon]|nr:class I SAM-dependent methyltransferase [Candidatus Jingweiarchaeum tengchongense]
MKCRNCGSELNHCILDLGTSPPANAFLSREDLNKPELWYPLRLLVCEKCFLVQTEDFVGRETLFNPNYVYFSSFSDTWLKHAKNYVEMVTEKFGLSEKSLVIEIGSNDGYLLQYFKNKNIPCYGVEPTHLVAEAARKKGIETVEEFFGIDLAKRLEQAKGQADLMVANNVLAHVPDIHDFLQGFYILLKPEGVATFEFQYVVPLIKQALFDTVYHEHFSYFSFTTVSEIFRVNGLKVFDVEHLPTHGGSLRVYVEKEDSGAFEISDRVLNLLEEEKKEGVRKLEFYSALQERAEKIKRDFLMFLLDAQQKGKKVAAYGAAAKGNTLINFCGVKGDLIKYVCDKNPYKQGKYLPGSRLPVVAPEMLKINLPDYVLIIPWNLKEEIIHELRVKYNENFSFVTALPILDLI